MKELFTKSLVVCAAISAFASGAYSLGTSVSNAFSNAIRKEISAYDQAVQAPSEVNAPQGGTSANMVPTPKAKSKFGITFEN